MIIIRKKQRLHKTVLSFFLAALLMLQAVPFNVMAYAQELPIASDALAEKEDTYAEDTANTDNLAEISTGAAIMALPVVLAGDTDKTSVFKDANKNFALTVTQDGKVISENSEINGRSVFTIALTGMWVPTKGDRTNSDGSDIIQKGDTVTLSKADYFPEVSLTATGSSDIKVGDQKIATVTFATDKITILFNGDDIFFGGGKKEVKISLTVTAKAADQTPGVSVDTSIFEHPYKLENAALEPQYSITLTHNNYSYSWITPAAFAEGVVEWKAVVTATDKSDLSIQMPLNKMVFSDALVDVGGYVGNSFKVSKVQVVGGKDQTPIEIKDAVPTISGTNMTYTFPDDFGAYKAVITFKTWIPKAKYYFEYSGTNGGLIGSTSYYQPVSNTAKLMDTDGNSENATSAAVLAALTPDWIQQYGKVSKIGDDTFVTWTIDVNKRNYHSVDAPKTGLKGMTITDVLPAGLEFVSSTYTVKGVDKGSISSTGNVFNIGDADGPVQLVIISKVTGSQTSFTNTPTARWSLDQANGNNQNNDAGVAATTTVTIGAHTFAKGSAISAADQNLGGVTWTVSLNLQYDLIAPTVYDVLVHGGDLSVLDSVDENTEISQAMLSKIKAQVNTAQLWQQYRDGTLTGSGGLTLEHIPLTKDGKPVADLIKVTGFKGETNASFSFRSVITNPDILFRQDINANKAIWNRAVLFDDETYQARAENSVNLHIRMLNKEMLYASKPLNANGAEVTAPGWNRSASWGYVTPNDKNWYTTNNFNDNYILAAYNCVDRTVTFRLAVNMPGYNTAELAKDGGNRVISDIKLVDTLPDGWEFVPFDDTGKVFELYKGYSDNSSGTQYGQYQRADTLLAPDGVVTFTQSGNTGTFTFSKLESPYVILVKARPTNEALKTYNPGINKVVNTAEFSMKLGGTLKSATETHPVIVPIQSLGKTVKKPASGVQEWTVNYTPPFQMKLGVCLQGTLGAGLQLRKDIDGSLSLAPSDLAVYKGKLKADGTLERVGAPLNLKDADCEIKASVEWGNSTTPTKLEFRMDNPNEMYQFVYQTESKGMTAGTSAGNKIELLGDEELPNISAQSSIVLDGNDVSGNASDNGMLYLKKVAPDSTTPLKGVRFELFNPDGSKAKDKNGSDIGEQITDNSGNAGFIIQIPGLYQLRQTYIDEKTYLPTTTIYWVRVIDAPGCPVIIDGKKIDSGVNRLVVPTPASGKLTVSNEVKGNGGELNKEFEYTIKFEGEGANGSYVWKRSDNSTNGDTDRIKNGDTFRLKHGENIVFPVLPKDIVYTVTQTDYTVDGYKTIPAADGTSVDRTYTGTVIYNGDHKAPYVNTRMLLGELFISNTVTGNRGDKTKEFDFKVDFAGDGAGGQYSYKKSDGTTGKIMSGDTIKLKHGETITVEGLLNNMSYTIIETDYAAGGYTTEPSSRVRTGAIKTNTTEKAEFVNNKTVTSELLIGNTVAGRDGDKNKLFDFKVEFTGEGADIDYSYERSDGGTGTIRDGVTIMLKDGETITIKELPVDLVYTVTEADYSTEDYFVNPATRVCTGNITEGRNQARFINTRTILGGLLISNEVKGNGGERDKEFEFTVTFNGYGKEATYKYTKLDGTEGTVKNSENLKLKHGEAAVIEELPTGLEYEVTQVDYTVEDYKTDPENFVHRGTIINKTPKEARFVNTKDVPVLHGLLRNNNTGNPIPYADITVTNVKTGEKHFLKTDANGEYSMIVKANEEYTVTYTRIVKVGGNDVPVEFTQKATVDGTVEGGDDVPADITAVGIVLFKQPDGGASLMNPAFAGNTNLYFKDSSGKYIEENGKPKAFPLEPNGTFSAEGLSEQKYTMEIRYEFEPGKELIIKKAELTVKADGELNISEELIDPYGTVYDKEKGITSGQIEGAEVTLYYANTSRNIGKGITPGTKVTLPRIPGFAPNDNASPSQPSDANGLYAYMVYPETDYYLVVTKTGYKTYTSDTISVEFDIVKHDVPMEKESSGGNGGSGGGSSGSGGGNKPDPVYGNIVVKMVDENRQELSGAEITLYDVNGKLAGKGVIGSDGTISFNKLLPGEYTIKETKAPEGYELSSKTFSVTVEGNKTAELELVKSRQGANNNNDIIKNESDGALTEDSNGPKGPETPKTPDAPKYIGTLPDTGYVLNTWMLAALGLLLIAEGIFLRKRRRIAN